MRKAARRCPIRGGARPAPHLDRPGSAPARALTHARILLKANQGEASPGWSDWAIAAALEVRHTTVARVRQQYAAGGLEAAVNRKLDGEQEARLVVLACSAPPEGRKRWTLRLRHGYILRPNGSLLTTGWRYIRDDGALFPGA